MKPRILTNGLIVSDGFRIVGSIVVDNGLITKVDFGLVHTSTIKTEN